MDRARATPRAAALLAVEGAALTGVGVVAAVLGDAEDRSASLATAVFALVAGVLLGLLGRAVWRGQTWARTPAVVLQLLALPVGTDMARGRVWPAAVAVLLLAGATLFHLVALGRE